jgi:hypothetical protein
MNFQAFCPHCNQLVTVESPLPEAELIRAIDEQSEVMVWHRVNTGEDHEWYMDAEAKSQIRALL